MHQPTPTPIPQTSPDPAPLPTRPASQPSLALRYGGYAALLADHCQLADQVTDLAGWLVQIQTQLDQLCNLLDLPRQPWPAAARAACAAPTAASLTSTDRPPAAAAGPAADAWGPEPGDRPAGCPAPAPQAPFPVNP